ncbi:thermonuclease family protein [Candidatus Babeliales bacterium]|nr:thermonuclease family protein [Candidatus Babeliales bacterium]
MLRMVTIEDDFNRSDAGSLGTASNGNVWVIDSSTVGNTLGIASNKYEFDIENTSIQGNNYHRLELDSSNPTRIDLNNITVTTDNTSLYPYIILGNGDANNTANIGIYIFFHRNTGTSMAYYDGAWNSIGKAMVSGVTYDVSIRNINYSTYTFDIYVDDVLEQSGASFWNNQAINFITFNQTQISGKDHNVTLDEITSGEPAVDSVTLITPNGGEDLVVGQSYDITWSSSGTVGALTIELSVNNGGSYVDIVTGESDDGTYSWTVNDTDSDSCLVRIGDGSVSDVSDAVFSISPPLVTDKNTGGSPGYVQSWLAPIQNFFDIGKGIIEFSNGLIKSYFPSDHLQITSNFRATVVKVHDGDTVTLKSDFRVFNFPLRLANINAPEMNAGGAYARDWLKERVLGKEVDVLIDPQNRVGKYGRLIGEIFVDGSNVNDEMLRTYLVPKFGSINHRIEPFDKILKRAGY